LANLSGDCTGAPALLGPFPYLELWNQMQDGLFGKRAAGRGKPDEQADSGERKRR